MTLREPTELPLKEYPRLTFGGPTAQTVRLFPDKMPIGIQRDGHDHRFLYLVTDPEPMDFRVFLLRHAELLRSLHQWTTRVLFPQPFARDSAVRARRAGGARDAD